jgi:hypothetical protein
VVAHQLVTASFFGRGGQNDDRLPSTSITTVDIEGTMFLNIENVKVPPSTSRSTKIGVAGSIIENTTVSVCTEIPTEIPTFMSY